MAIVRRGVRGCWLVPRLEAKKKRPDGPPACQEIAEMSMG